MGDLRNFNMENIREYGCSCYIETGTGEGVTLTQAKAGNFERYTTVDLDQNLIDKLKPHHDDVDFIQGYSHEVLPQIIRDHEDVEQIFFFLDAHFPDADYNGASYVSDNTDENLPLHFELKTISEMRKNKKDVIVCDDLRIYLKGNYQFGNIPGTWDYLGNIDFVYKFFPPSHYDISTLLYQHGFICIKGL